MLQNYVSKIKFLLPLISLTLFYQGASGQQVNRSITPIDTTIEKSGSRPSYRWRDSYLNRFSYDLPRSPLFLNQFDSLKTHIYYQPSKDLVDVDEKLSEDIDVKIPQSMSFNEYASIQNAMVRHSILRDYERMQDGNSNTSGRGISPLLKKVPFVDKLFGGKVPEFHPTGFVAIDLRVGSQFNNNPQLPVYQRRRPVFDFDQQISINFNNNANQGSQAGGFQNGSNPGLGNGTNSSSGLGNLKQLAQGGGLLGGNRSGASDPLREKMGILGNFDTKSAFNFENQFKLNFKSDPEDILQSLELGNVNFPLKSQLIPGVENLFGVKAGLRFGKLNISTVVAQQRSRTESIYINGGAQNRPFEIRSDEYDENRHFFLSHFFRDNYEKSLKNLPMVTSEVLITRVEVYVTNRTNTVNSMRNLVGLADLGEVEPYNTQAVAYNNGKDKVASNEVNSLNEKLITQQNASFRDVQNTSSSLEGLQLQKGVDFELLRGAKKLTGNEFDFNPQLGYISLLTPLRNDEILAVAYEYTYRGKHYKVGELTEDYAIRQEDEVLVLKLLKSSSIRNHLSHPMWDLMMKNVYSLGQSQISREGFQLRVLYKDDKTGIDNPNLQEGKNLKNVPLVQVLGLDKLNFNNDPFPDGNFDYVQGVTINEDKGVVIFPKLEPFGSFLKTQFDASTESTLIDKYVYDELYSRTQTDAKQINTKNKFFLSGVVQNNSSDIPLPLGASGASVRVYSGGVELSSGTDFIVDEQLGRVRIVNPSILASSRPIRIDYERPDLFQSQIRRLFGLRMDYTVNRHLRLGATLMDLKENTPGFITRTSIGNEPVNNMLWGLDLSYKQEGNGFTRLLDKLPLIQTKEPSAIILDAEFAQLRPGVNTKKTNGNSMIDDFESARNINDLTRQPNRWRLGSTPEKFRIDSAGVYGYNYRRAKLSIYTIDQSTFITNGFGGGLVPPELTQAASENLYERGFIIQDIFPGRSKPVLGQNLPTNILDLSYLPEERGMYNYNPDLTSEGYLKNPEDNFGAVMHGLTFDADFDNANVEYLEFWMLDPFKDVVRDGRKPDGTRNTDGGDLVFQLGDISEDVIPDSYNNFESGLPTADQNTNVQITPWGKAPKSQYITDAFSTDADSRAKQDVGLDGLSNEDERNTQHIKDYLTALKTKLNPDVYADFEADPSGDDFKYFLDDSFNSGQFIVERFKNYLGMEGNSPNINKNDQITQAYAVTADKEDINQDNTINDIESYHEYRVPLKDGKLQVGEGFIVDKVSSDNADWYLFRIPLRTGASQSVGGIEGFKSIRFMRMVMEEWKQPVVLRFAALQLIANSYRVYAQDLNDHGYAETKEKYDAQFSMTTVSVEENGCSQDGDCNVKAGQTPYVVPPGFVRDRDFSQNIGVNRLFNEQSISLNVGSLKDGDGRAVFKNTQLDLNMYKRIQMFVHMHNDQNLDGMAGAFLRIGTDVKNNYYEVAIDNLKATPNGVQSPELIWPGENEIDIPLDEFRNLKTERNLQIGTDTSAIEKPYSKTIQVTGESGSGVSMTRTYRITVVGNPDLSNILMIMNGVTNPEGGYTSNAKFTVWMDELRTNGYNTEAGEAGLLAADIKLADIGTVSISGNFSTFGFGGVQNRISNRLQSRSQGFGISSSLEMDKFFPEAWGLSIPLFINYDQQEVIPHYNPLNPDIVLEDALSRFDTQAERNAFRSKVIDRNVNKGFNLANVRKIKTDPTAKSHFYDIENFSFSYAQSKVTRSNILIQQYLSEHKAGGLTYQFQPKAVNWEPFKDKKGLENPIYTWIRDFNLSPMPSLIAFKTDFVRNYTRTQYRNSQLETDGIDPNYIKYFLTNRLYDVQWNLTKSVNIIYSAQMNSIIDEPFGDKNTDENKEAIWKNLLSFGRAKNFNQNIQLTYQLPLDKFFILDWMQADTRLDIDYNYRANSYDWVNKKGIEDEFGQEFGNFIDNNREIAIQGRIDLVKLYNKFKYLKFANSPNQQRERFTRSLGAEEDILMPSSSVMKTFTRLLMTVRGINFNYSIVESTLLPGFMPSPNMIGLAKKTDQFAPGLPFVLGSQRRDFDKYAAEKGWLSKSTVRNDPFTQTRQKKFGFSTNLEPFAGFRMQINGDYSRGDSYQEIYRPDSPGGSNFQANNPYRTGTFSMTFWSFKTSFAKMQKDSISSYSYQIFDNMVANRERVRDKLNNIVGGEGGQYDINSQDVLIPAFFAAYSGTTVDKLYAKAAKKGQQTFNPFLGFPLPNWRIDYTGLEKLPGLNKVFSSITLSHNYKSTYSVGNFTSSLSYGAQMVNLMINDYPLGTLPNPMVFDETGTNYFMPVFIMSTITMEEQMSPLIGVNFTTKSNFSGRLEFNKERRASLNLSNAQVAEYNSKSFIFGIGLKKNDVKLPFKGRDGKKMVLTNDLNFRFDVTLRDDTMIQRRLDGDAVPIQGNYNLQVKPQIQYQFNKRLNMGFYIEHFVNTPFTSISYQTIRTVGGINAKFNLAD
ncbi:cell surface protein SprA [Marinilongibacter aquaticus]|uniref:T9SS outer membrane translocon Sov/SprA n=1 Tax=Marinilongibacter aquaticus TaxID=2975157 RepID=UPI0021BD586C|nr:cell surface protein SprA [Marinilongibacter aquaticus]UBM59817.1 cell surface protein SprA [Marinilongibacter aquaticus]